MHNILGLLWRRAAGKPSSNESVSQSQIAVVKKHPRNSDIRSASWHIYFGHSSTFHSADHMNTFAVMFNEYDKWEQNDSRSLTFRSAKLLVQQDEWEQDESRSEALKAAALAEGMSQWEECSDRSSLFRRATAEVCG
jgi:hypothetical protein